MEYLMTYGWAILIVIIVVAALYAMGVFNVSSGVTCSPCFSNFAFVDYANGNLKIRNGPQAIKYFNATDASGQLTVSSATLDAGGEVTISGISTSGDQDITLHYTVTASDLTHTDTATIHN